MKCTVSKVRNVIKWYLRHHGEFASYQKHVDGLYKELRFKESA